MTAADNFFIHCSFEVDRMSEKFDTSYISSKRESYGLVVESEEHALLHRTMCEALLGGKRTIPVNNWHVIRTNKLKHFL